MNSAKIKELIRSILVITFGAAVFAVGFAWFYLPNSIASGGLIGLAQIVNHLLTFMPVGVTVIILNVPLFILCLKLIGGRSLLLSLYAMFISSVIIDALDLLVTFQPLSDPLLSSIFAGLLMGISLGIVISQEATTGGTDLLARLLKLRFKWLAMGKLLLVADQVVILLVSLVFKTMYSMLYGLVALYISTIVMDSILYGMNPAKVAYIISDHDDEIKETLVHKLDRGVTILHGQGGYSGSDKKVLMCAFKQKEIATIKHAVKDVDPTAFLIVCDAHEVLGEGFRAYKKDDI